MPLRKFALCLSDVESKSEGLIYEYNGKKFINIMIRDLPKTDDFGKSFVVELEIPKEEWSKPISERSKPIELCKGKFIYTKKEKEALGLYQDNIDKPNTTEFTHNAKDLNDDLPF